MTETRAARWRPWSLSTHGGNRPLGGPRRPTQPKFVPPSPTHPVAQRGRGEAGERGQQHQADRHPQARASRLLSAARRRGAAAAGLATRRGRRRSRCRPSPATPPSLGVPPPSDSSPGALPPSPDVPARLPVAITGAPPPAAAPPHASARSSSRARRSPRRSIRRTRWTGGRARGPPRGACAATPLQRRHAVPGTRRWVSASSSRHPLSRCTDRRSRRSARRRSTRVGARAPSVPRRPARAAAEPSPPLAGAAPPPPAEYRSVPARSHRHRRHRRLPPAAAAAATAAAGNGQRGQVRHLRDRHRSRRQVGRIRQIRQVRHGHRRRGRDLGHRQALSEDPERAGPERTRRQESRLRAPPA